MKDEDNDNLKEKEVKEEESESKQTLPKTGPQINFDYHDGNDTTPNTLDDLVNQPAKGEDENPPDSSHMNHQKPHQSSFSYPSNSSVFSETVNRRTKNSLLPLFVLFLIGVGIVSGTVFLLKNRSVKWQTTPTPASTTKPSSTPESTPLALNRSKYKVRVLNGTTTTGLAASVSAKLKDLGYQTDKFANATVSSFAQTVVRVKSSNSDLAKQLIQDLSYQFNATTSSQLIDSDTVDSEIILGIK